MNLIEIQPLLMCIVITFGICFVVVILKNQLGNFITKLSHFHFKTKKGDNETSLELASGSEKERIEQSIETNNQSIDKIPEVTCLIESAESAPKKCRVDQFNALKNEGKESGEKVYNELLQNAKNDDDLFQIKLNFIEDCFYTGNATSDEYSSLLSTYKNDVEKVNRLYLSLGMNLKYNHRYHDSISKIKCIIDNNPNENILTSAIVALSELYNDINSKADSITILTSYIDNIKDKKNISMLYYQLGQCYKEENKDLANVFYNQAGILDPDNYNLLFNIAYNTVNTLLSYYYYRIVVASEPDNYTAQNNLGAAYDYFKLPINSISYYRKAYRNGITLSAANMARKLLDNGFIDEAKEILDKAKSQESVHKNVYNCYYDIETKAADETKKITQLEKNASNLTLFLSRNINFFITNYVLPDGDYFDQTNNCTLTINRIEEKVNLVLKLKSNTYNSKFDKKGAIITFKRQSEYFVPSSDIKSYLAFSDNRIELLVINEDSPYQEYTFTK